MTELGFGASGPWAEPWFAEEKARAVLDAALGAGITDVDTSPSYAGGNAEARLGMLLSALTVEGRPAPRVSSKVGTKLGKGRRLIKDFSADAIERQLDGSLVALGRPFLDILYLHGPDKHELTSALPVLTKLQETGRIKAIGVCADRHHIKSALECPEVDWIMSPFNALNQTNYRRLRKAKRLGKKIAVVAPMGQALWRSDLYAPRSREGFWYAARALRGGPGRIAAARKAAWLKDVPGWTPPELAVAFVREALSPDLILTTTTNPAHIEETARAMTRAVQDALRERLQGLIVS